MFPAKKLAIITWPFVDNIAGAAKQVIEAYYNSYAHAGNGVHKPVLTEIDIFNIITDVLEGGEGESIAVTTRPAELLGQYVEGGDNKEEVLLARNEMVLVMRLALMYKDLIDLK